MNTWSDSIMPHLLAGCVAGGCFELSVPWDVPNQVEGMDREMIAAELLALEREERELSEFRRRLHDQIDNGFPNEFTVARERAVSARRREVHARIDALRSALG